MLHAPCEQRKIRLLAALWISPLVYAFWAAFHPGEYAVNFHLLAPLTLDNFREALSQAPARILGLSEQGRLAPGCLADVTILDPEALHVVSARRFRSLSRNTPFDGWRCRGQAVMTVVGLPNWEWMTPPDWGWMLALCITGATGHWPVVSLTISTQQRPSASAHSVCGP